MRPKLQFDNRELQRSILRVSQLTGQAASDITNQAILDIASHAFGQLKPGKGVPAIDAARQKVRDYMRVQYATKIKFRRKSGKFVARGRTTTKNLLRRHLISQAIAKRMGYKGLYGKRMTKFSAALTRAAQTSQGYLQTLFIPVISAFNQLARYKFPYREYAKRSIWGASRFQPKGFETASQPSTPGDSVGAAFAIDAKVAPRQYGKAEVLLTNAINSGIANKAGKLERLIASTMVDIANTGKIPKIPKQ